MSSAQTLREAALVIEGYLDALPPAPWAMTEHDDHLDVSGPLGWMACTDAEAEREQLVRWIVLSPTLLRMVGEYLEDLAGDAEEMAADMRAVAIAEVVLAALPQ